MFKIPYFITIHWGKEPDWKFPYPFISYFRHARTVIGVSEPVCSAFKIKIPDQDFQYIPPLIPFQTSTKSKLDLKKQLGYNNQENILLFVGSMKKMKNPDKIVEAFSKIGIGYLEQKNIHLILIGTGEMDNELKDIIKQRQLGKFIRMEGIVNRVKIPEYFKAADAYIISSDYEGTSISLLEAMYNRLAIIGSDAPGINGMLAHDKNALLYKTNDTDQLAETIKYIFSDHCLSERLGARAFSDFEGKYSYESMITKYQQIFSSVQL